MFLQLLDIGLTVGAALLLLVVVGYAPTYLLLTNPHPALSLEGRGLIPARCGILVTPVVGLAVTVVFSQWLTIFLPMGAAVWLLMGVGLVGAGLAVWHREKSQVSKTPHSLPRSQGKGGKAEGLAVVGLAILSLFLGLWPLVGQPAKAGQPDLIALGPNWDWEIYLPLAEYLKDYPVGFSLEEPAGFPFGSDQGRPFVLPLGRIRAGPFPAPPNPLLWRVDFAETRAGGLGFSLFQSGVGALTGQEAHRTFAPLMALLLALSALGGYVFYRGAWGLGVGASPSVRQRWIRASLLGTAFLSVNSALLYVLFWSFGQQVTALALFPLALSAGLWAMTNGGVRAALLGALMLSALLVSYVPVVPFYGALLGVMGLFCPNLGKESKGKSSSMALLFSPDGRKRLFKNAGILVGFSMILSPMAYWRLAVMAQLFLQGGGSGGLTEGPGVVRYASLGWAFGLLAGPGAGGVTDWPAGVSNSAIATLYPLVFILALGLALMGLWLAFRLGRVSLVAGVLASLGLLGGLRFLLGYPYGYLKLLPFLSLLFIGAMTMGLSYFSRRCRIYPMILIRKMRRRLGPVGLPLKWRLVSLGLPMVGAGVMLLLMVVSLGNALDVVGQARRDSPHRFGELAALERLVEPKASVYISSGMELQGPRAGALAYFLRRAELYGYIRTGYSTFFRLKPEGVYDYAIFSRDEMPYPELYGDMEPLWEGGEVRLYGRPDGVLTFVDLGLGEGGPIVPITAGRGRAAGILVDRWSPEGYPQIRDEGGFGHIVPKSKDNPLPIPVSTAGRKWSPPLLGVLSPAQEPKAAYPEVTSARPFPLPMDKLVAGVSASEAGRPVAPGSLKGRAEKELILTLASFAPARLLLYQADPSSADLASQAVPILVSPGLHSYPLPLLCHSDPPKADEESKACGTLRAESPEPVYVKSVMVREEGRDPKGVSEHRGNFLVRSEADLVTGKIQLSLAYWGPSFTPVLDIYGIEKSLGPSKLQGQGDKRHFGWWALSPEGPVYWQEARKLLIEFDPQARIAIKREDGGGAVTLPGEHWEDGDGLFQAYLFLWRDGAVRRAVPLFQFTIEGGRLTALTSPAQEIVIG